MKVQYMKKIECLLSDSNIVQNENTFYESKVSQPDFIKLIGKDIYKMFNKDVNAYEEMFAIHLSRSNEIIGVHHVSSGGLHGTMCDPKKIFAMALTTLAASIILVHNHPSGNCKPSDSDIQLTRKISDAGKLLTLPVLDHIIITDDSYYSFADHIKI